MVVNHARGLHERVDDDGPAEAEALGPECPRERARKRRLGRYLARLLPRILDRPEVDEAPQEAGETLALLDREKGARRCNRRLHLAPVAHDARVRERLADLRLTPTREGFGIEPREAPAEVVALAQDRQPAQPRLEAVEDEFLEQGAPVGLGPAPLVIVIGDIERIGAAPRTSPGHRRILFARLTKN